MEKRTSYQSQDAPTASITIVTMTNNEIRTAEAVLDEEEEPPDGGATDEFSF